MKIPLAIVSVLCLASLAWCQSDSATSVSNNAEAYSVQDSLELTLDAFVVTQTTNDAGETEEVFTAAEAAEPGSVVEYRLTAHNTSEGSLSGVVLRAPIPAKTFYLDNSASGSDAAVLEYSAPGYTSPSGEAFGAAPLTQTLVINGQEMEVVIPAETYSAIRWTLLEPIAAESERVFTYRVEVE